MRRQRVQVHHPLQQGLRLVILSFSLKGLGSTSASSITTRIKTYLRFAETLRASCVQVHHPLQQGLRLWLYLHHTPMIVVSTSASSITTRIKTR